MSPPSVPPASQQIRSLMEMEKRIPTLLSLLSQALTALLPPDPDAPPLYHEDGTLVDAEERFPNLAKQYYEELDEIQLTLRATVHHLRLARILPAPSDFVPPAPHLPPPTSAFPAPPRPQADDGASGVKADGKAIFELQVERDNLVRMRGALKALRKQPLPPPVTDIGALEDPAIAMTVDELPSKEGHTNTITVGMESKEIEAAPEAVAGADRKSPMEDEDEDAGEDEEMEEVVP